MVWVKNHDASVGPYYLQSLHQCSLCQCAGDPADFLLLGSSALTVVGESFRGMAINISPFFDFFFSMLLLLRVQDQERLAEIFQFQVIVLCSCCGWEILDLLRTTAGQWELENTSKRLKDGTFFSFRIS